MSNTASLELCRELYELSGGWGYRHNYPKDGVHDLTDSKWYSFEGKTTGSYWEAVYDEHYNRDPFDNRRPTGVTHKIEWLCPAYTAGYLFRKLPKEHLRVYYAPDWECWGASIERGGMYTYTGKGDTPEDALCKLSIALFKEGVLSHE